MNALRFAAICVLGLAACKASNPSVPRAKVAPVPEPNIQPDSAPQESVVEDSRPAEAAIVSPRAAAAEPIVARVGDDVIYVSELLKTWMLADSTTLRDILGTLATAHIVRRESARLGIELDEEELVREYGIALAEMESGLQQRQPGVSLDEWIAGGLGLDPLRYRQSIREDIERRLLAERVVRHFVVTRDNAVAAVIVVADQDAALAALERARAGENFAALAAELSLDPTGKRTGGKLPPIVRNDSAFARLAFATAEGEIGGPVEEGGRWMLLRTLKINAPLKGKWAELGPTIEESLVERPIEQPEFLLWKAEMQDRTPADFEPFFELIGEPSRRSQP